MKHGTVFVLGTSGLLMGAVLAGATVAHAKKSCPTVMAMTCVSSNYADVLDRAMVIGPSGPLLAEGFVGYELEWAVGIRPFNETRSLVSQVEIEKTSEGQVRARVSYAVGIPLGWQMFEICQDRPRVSAARAAKQIEFEVRPINEPECPELRRLGLELEAIRLSPLRSTDGLIDVWINGTHYMSWGDDEHSDAFDLWVHRVLTLFEGTCPKQPD